jgi:NAD+ kinase
VGADRHEEHRLDVAVQHDGVRVWGSFALNEVSVEKAARERMLEVVVDMYNRTLARWGCDGVVLAARTVTRA